MNEVMMVVAGKPGYPSGLRFTCRLCQQYSHPMRADTAAVHLVHKHGYGWIGAEMAVRQAASDAEYAEAQPAGKSLLDVFGD